MTIFCALFANAVLAGTVSVSGDAVTFTGAFDEAQTLPSGKASCRVVLEGAEFRGGIRVPEGMTADFVASAGTTNVFSRISAEKANVRFVGAGLVVLEGPDTLMTVADLTLSSGALKVRSTGCSAGEARLVAVLGSYLQSGGFLELDLGQSDQCRVHGIALLNKAPCHAEIAGGEVKATVAGVRSSAFRGEKGSVDFVFKGDALRMTAMLCGNEARLVDTAGKQTYAGGTYEVKMPHDFGRYAKPRVFKADERIKVKGGDFDVNVPGPGAEVFSSDDAIVVDGGTLRLVADDDCFSAVNNITVNGGLLRLVSLNDDVLDSNGDIVVNGGTIVAYTAAKGHEAFDVDPMKTSEGTNPHRLTVNGGTIFATGGKDSDWPAEIVKGQGVVVYAQAGLASSAFSGRYLTLPVANGVGATARLPLFRGRNCAILATCPGFTGEPVTADDRPAKDVLEP